MVCTKFVLVNCYYVLILLKKKNFTDFIQLMILFDSLQTRSSVEKNLLKIYINKQDT